jgi:uncharacterized protein YndB with AHSA1/START domain
MLPEKESIEVASPTADRELKLSRLLHAPVELVWEVWTNPEHIKNWWGPVGFSNTISKMDLQPGGEWNLVMHGPDGKNYKNKSIFREVVKHRKIVYDHVSAPLFTATIEFEKRGDTTFLTWHMLFATREEFIKTVQTFGADKGLQQNIEKLANYVSKGYALDELLLTRLIDVPVELAFKAWTEPSLLAKWWGPDGFTSPVCDWEAVKGGRIYIEMQAPDGTLYPMDGEVREVHAPNELIFLAAALDDKRVRLFEVLNTVTVAEEKSKSRVTLHARVLNSRAGSEQYIRGMNEGWNQSLERLINLIE